MEEEDGCVPGPQIDTGVHSFHGCDEKFRFCEVVELERQAARVVFKKDGEVAQKLEESLGVRVVMNNKGKFGLIPCDFRGPSEEAVQAARRMVMEELEEVVAQPNYQYTHFVSLPLATTAFCDRLLDFQRRVLAGLPGSPPAEDEEEGAATGQGGRKRGAGDAKGVPWHGVEPSVFVKPETLHLTVQMLKLWSGDRVRAAEAALQAAMPAVHDALEGRPVSVRLQGLKTMQGSKGRAHVVYIDVAHPDGSERLLRACNVLKQHFLEAGLVGPRDDTRDLKFHATVINTRMRKFRYAGGVGRRIPVDARPLLEEHGTHDFGEHVLSEAHLSQRFFYEESGYYRCCARLPLPMLPEPPAEWVSR